MFINNFYLAEVIQLRSVKRKLFEVQTLAMVVSSALRIYLHMAFLMREGGIQTKSRTKNF